jgi:hypothetical protein
MISHRYSTGICSILLLGCLLVIAQTASAQTAKLGTISGTVVNESGRPLSNARVMLRRPGGVMGLENLSTTTDRKGKFEVSGLEPVNYQVLAILQGYVPLLRDLDDTQPPVYRTGDSVTLVLTKGGVITGTVTNQAGEPIVGVNVRAGMVNAPNRFPYTYYGVGVAAITDDRGIYRIYGLPEGTYVVWAGSGEGYTSNIDPYEGEIPTYAPASTRDAAQEIAVRPGAEASGIDIQYRGGSGHAVSGKARASEGAQPQQFAILLNSASGPQWQLRSYQADNQRGFMLQGVDDGDYSITAVSQRAKDEFMFSAPRQIKVRGADVTGIDLLVEPLAAVSGRLVLEETKATGCSDKQRPVLSETLVSAQSDKPQPAFMFLLPKTSPDERGNISLKNLLPGRYYFTAQYFAKDWYLKSLLFAPPETAATKAGNPLDAARTWTRLKGGDRLNGLTITLAQGAASVRGHIALSEGETLADKLYVYLVPTLKEAGDDPLRFYVAPVTAEGKVSLNHLAPGHYLVLAQAVADGSASPLTRVRLPDEKAFRTGLRRAAEQVKTELELKPCQRVADLQVPVRTN